MTKRTYSERRKKYARTIVIFGIFCGLLYPVLSREFDDPVAFLNGLLIGLLGSLFIASYELYGSRNRRVIFSKKFLVKTFAYTLFFVFLIPFVYSITRSIESNLGYLEYLGGDAFSRFLFEEDYGLIVLYTLFLTGSIVFTNQLTRKLGHGVLWNLISGKYHKPRKEERIIMFIDVNSSTQIAEKLGDISYNKLMNDFFYDITDSIIDNLGDIYSYVGDGMVVSWPIKTGLRNSNWLNASISARQSIEVRKKIYLDKYGLIPEFSVGTDLGTVTIGQIGDIKSRIAINGEVMYTTPNIEKQCRKNGVDNLASEALTKLTSFGPGLRPVSITTMPLANGGQINLFTIPERESTKRSA